MAEKINIATIDIDTKSLLNATAQIKKQIDQLKEEQKALQKQGQSSSKQFVQNAVDLKNLSKAYNSNTKELAENTKALEDEEDAIEAVNNVLNQEVKTIKQAREQNKILNKLRNDTNATTEEGRAQIDALNAKLDENNAFVKENADGYLKLKLQIGDYAGGIKEAFSELNIFNGGLTGFISRAQDAGGVTNLLTSSLKLVSQSVLGLTKATLAFIATPIGVIIAALAAVFALVANAINRSEESANKITKIFTIFSGVVNKLLSFLEPLGDFIINGLVAGFELLGVIAEKTLGLLASALSFLGFEDAAASITGFNEELKETVETAERLANAEAKLTKELRRQGLVQLEFQKQAEKLRQLRDDESKSIQERIQANEDLGKVLQEQLKEELRIANLALEVADLRIKQDGERTELLDQQADALLKIAEIEERITSQTSEQLTNRNALLKEQNDLIRERIQLSIKSQEDELALLKLQDKQIADSLEVRIALQEEYAAEERAIAKRKLESGTLNETQYAIRLKEIDNDLAESREELRNDELQKQQDFEARRDDLLNSIRLKRLEDEQARQELENQIEFEKQVAELEALEISESQKTELLRLLTEERELILQEIRNSFRDEEIEKLKEYYEEQINLGAAVTESEKQQATARAQIATVLTNTLRGLLGQSIAAQLASVAIDAAVQSGLLKIESASASARITSSIAAANAAAIAASPLTAGLPFTTINTSQGAALQSALITQTTAAQAKIIQSAAIRGFGTIAGGFKAEKGGVFSVDGNSHAQGGVPIFAGNKFIGEAEGGEGIGILSRPAFDSFIGFNNQFTNGSIGTTFAQNGGILTPDLNSSASLSFSDLETILDSYPPPIVYVEDIKTGVNNVNEVEVMADI